MFKKKVSIPGQSGGEDSGMIARASFSCNIIYMKKKKNSHMLMVISWKILSFGMSAKSMD